MTKFDLAKFDMGYGSERYVKYDGKFVARFKYRNAAACSKHFVKFLVANFTVEEYFELCEGPQKLAPMLALATKGYEDYNTLRAMKKGGYASVAEMRAAQLAAIHARMALAKRSDEAYASSFAGQHL